MVLVVVRVGFLLARWLRLSFGWGGAEAVFVVCELSAAAWAFPGVGCRVFGPDLDEPGFVFAVFATHP